VGRSEDISCANYFCFQLLSRLLMLSSSESSAHHKEFSRLLCICALFLNLIEHHQSPGNPLRLIVLIALAIYTNHFSFIANLAISFSALTLNCFPH